MQMAENELAAKETDARKVGRSSDPFENNKSQLQQGHSFARGRGSLQSSRGVGERSNSPSGQPKGRGRGRTRRPDMQVYIPKGKRQPTANETQSDTQLTYTREQGESLCTIGDPVISGAYINESQQEAENKSARKIRRAGKTYAEVYVPRPKRMQLKTNSDSSGIEIKGHTSLHVNQSNNLKRPKSAGSSPKAKMNSQHMQRNRKNSKSTEDLSVEMEVSQVPARAEDQSEKQYTYMMELSCSTSSVEAPLDNAPFLKGTKRILTEHSEMDNTYLTETTDLTKQNKSEVSENIGKAQVFDKTQGTEIMVENLLKSEEKSSEIDNRSMHQKVAASKSENFGANDKVKLKESEFTPEEAPKDDIPCRNSSQESHSVIRCYLVSSAGKVGDNVSCMDTKQQFARMWEEKIDASRASETIDNDTVEVQHEELGKSCNNTSKTEARSGDGPHEEGVYLSIHSIHNSAKTEGIYCAAGTSVCSVLQACQTVTSDHIAEVMDDSVSTGRPDQQTTEVQRKDCSDLSSENVDLISEHLDDSNGCGKVNIGLESKFPSAVADLKENNMVIQLEEDDAYNISVEDPSIIDAGSSTSVTETREIVGEARNSENDSAHLSLSEQDPCVIKAKCSPKSVKEKKSSKKKKCDLQDQDSSIVEMASDPCGVVSALDAIFGSNTDVIAKKTSPTVTASKVEQQACEKENTVEKGDVEEDDWENLFNDDGDALDPKLMEELTIAVGKVKVQKPKIDYQNFQPREPDLDYEEYSHLIEIYDFPKEHITSDLLMAFRDYQDQGFDIKWVDDTHAIGVFASSIAAHSALQMRHPLIKVRSISQATRQTKLKAKRCSEFLQPYKPRPETTAAVARKLVSGALGIQTKVPKEKRDEERRIIKEAREKKKEARKQKQNAWDGNIGKCAMDET